MKTRAVITGANGFVGTHLAAHLRKKGIAPIALPRSLFTESRGARTPVASAPMTIWLQEVNPNFIFHLAGNSSHSQLSYLIESNVLPAATLLECTAAAGLADAPILMVGSAAEFGLIRREDLPVMDDRALAPISAYGLSKSMQTRVAEKAIRDGRKIVYTRPFNIVGPGMPSHLVPQTFVDQLVALSSANEKILKVGNLSTSRDFISGESVAQIFAELITNAKAWGQTVNICTGESFGIGDIVHNLAHRFGGGIQVEVTTELVRPIDVPVVIGSTTKLESLIGYCPKFNFERTLDQIVAEAKARRFSQ